MAGKQEDRSAVLITRTPAGYEARLLMPAWFIPCIGASASAECSKFPSSADACLVDALGLANGGSLTRRDGRCNLQRPLVFKC